MPLNLEVLGIIEKWLLENYNSTHFISRAREALIIKVGIIPMPKNVMYIYSTNNFINNTISIAFNGLKPIMINLSSPNSFDLLITEIEKLK